MRVGESFNPAWHGLPTVSALTGGCCDLTWLGVSHILSWFSCVPAGTAALLGVGCLQSQPLHLVAHAAAQLSQLPYSSSPWPNPDHGDHLGNETADRRLHFFVCVCVCV